MPAACRHLLLPSIHEPVHRWASDQAVGNMVSRLSHDSSIEQYRGTYVIADILHVRVKFQLSPNNRSCEAVYPSCSEPYAVH